jgi:hypothetical protein
MNSTDPPVADMLRSVLGLVAAETAAPLTRALDRVHELRQGIRPGQMELQALCEDLAAARRAGMVGQQIARLACGEFRVAEEPVDLALALSQLLADHRVAAGPMTVEFREQVKPATVVADLSLVGTLVQSLLAWCSECSTSAVAMRLAPREGAPQALLVCRFNRRVRPEEQPEPLSWYLMRSAAQALGARLSIETETHTTVVLLFDRLVTTASLDRRLAADANRLAGSQVLVLAPDRDVRQQVRQAIQGLDLIVDYVNSVDAARQFCEDGLPQAVVYASALGGATLERWRKSLNERGGTPPFIEIDPEAHGFEPLGDHDRAAARVGMEGLAQSLPAALALELSRRR